MSSLFFRRKNPNPMVRRGFVLLVFPKEKSEPYGEERICPPCFSEGKIQMRACTLCPYGEERICPPFLHKKMCTYPISRTYADKLHTLKCIIYFHNVRLLSHKKRAAKPDLR